MTTTIMLMNDNDNHGITVSSNDNMNLSFLFAKKFDDPVAIIKFITVPDQYLQHL